MADNAVQVQADVMFVIEGTAINGAYLNDMKTNYLTPTTEFFSQGNIEDRDYVCEVGSILLHVCKLPGAASCEEGCFLRKTCSYNQFLIFWYLLNSRNYS